MTKTYRTAAPEPARPAYSAPEAFTLKRARAIALAFGALVLLVLAVWLALQTWMLPAAVTLVLAAYVGINAGLLWEYSNRLIAKELPRGERRIRATSTGPIYFRRNISVAGDPVDVGETPIDFGSLNAGQVQRALTYLRNGGATSRGAMTKALGISQGDWAKLITGLEDLGIVANNGRAGVQVVGDLSAAIDDLAAQLDRW